MRLLLIVLSLLLMSSLANAVSVFPLDDSATVVHAPTVAMRWRGDHGGPRSSTLVDGRLTVDLVLDTRAFVGRQARVYMLLAPHPVRFSVQWRTGGTLQPGRIEPGQRVLVYQGPIAAVTLRDRLEVAVSADGREYGVLQRLNVKYEIETLN